MQDHCSRSPQGDGQIAAARSSRAIVVSRQQRDAIHPELLISLTRIGDVSILVDRGEYEEAAKLAREMRDVTRLLDDLGWDADADESETEFEITLGAADLARAVYQLQVRASGALVSEIREAQATEPVGMVHIDARVALRNGSLAFDEMSLKAVGGAPIRPDLRINCRYASNGDSCGDSRIEYFRYTTARIYNRDVIKHPWGRRYRHHFNFYWRAQGFRNASSPDGKWHAVPIPISSTFVCRKYRYECIFQ